jgi:hypothetical protein
MIKEKKTLCGVLLIHFLGALTESNYNYQLGTPISRCHYNVET